MQGQPFELKETVVSAGAGAGKTTALVSHVLETVQSFRDHHGRWPRIVTTTFTRKATQELRERLLKKSRELQNQDLIRYVLAKTDLQVTTIHGVLYTLLTKHGHRIGLDPQFQLVDDEQLVRMAKSVLIKLAEDDCEFSNLIRYLSVQKLAELFVQLYREKSFNPNTAVIDRESYFRLLAQLFDHLCSEVVQMASMIQKTGEGPKWKEFSQHLTGCAHTLSETKSIEKFQHELSKVRKPNFKEDRPDIDVETHNQLETLRKKWKDIDPLLSSEEHIEKYLSVHDSLASVYDKFHQEYERRLRKSGSLSISDLEVLSLRLLREAPDAFHAFSESWDYWLIDEYQDTSPSQVELLKKLVGSRPSYTVGDPQQSIYLFRGAQVGVFKDRLQSVQAAGGHVQVLDKSWRSEPEYVEFMNRLFPRFGSGFKKMVPKSDRELCPSKVAIWARTKSEQDEFNSICQQLNQLLKSGVRPKDIGILARKNATLEKLAQSLEQMGFPVQVVSSGGFFGRREILDMVAILKTMINPHDNASLVEALRSPWIYAEDKNLASWSASRAKGESLWQVLNRLDIQDTGVQLLKTAIVKSEQVGLITAFEELAVETGMIDFSADHDSSGQKESNIWKFILLLRSTYAKAGTLHAEILHKMLQTTDLDSAAQETQAVAAFEPDKTVLMTIHASKGLEFEHVILPDVGARPSAIRERENLFYDGIWSISFKDLESDEVLQSPAWFFETQKRRLEEAQEFERLFYVAITRAKKSVLILDGDEVTKGSWSERLEKAWPDQCQFCEQVVEFPGEAQRWVSIEKQKTQDILPLSKTSFDSSHVKRHSVTALLSKYKVVAGQEATHVAQELLPQKSSSQVLQRRIGSSLKGTRIHKCLEALHYGGQPAYTELSVELLGAKSSDAKKAMEYIFSVSQPPLEHLIKTGHVEWGFHFTWKNIIVEGQIDLWGLDHDDIWVIDYKTGHSDQVEGAFQQLTIYAYAIGLRQKSHQNIKMCVVYPFEKKVVTRDYVQDKALDLLEGCLS